MLKDRSKAKHDDVNTRGKPMLTGAFPLMVRRQSVPRGACLIHAATFAVGHSVGGSQSCKHGGEQLQGFATAHLACLDGIHKQRCQVNQRRSRKTVGLHIETERDIERQRERDRERERERERERPGVKVEAAISH